MATTTSTKAHVGAAAVGTAAYLSDELGAVANWLLTLLPFWTDLPEDVQGALARLAAAAVAAGAGWLAVWWTANRPKALVGILLVLALGAATPAAAQDDPPVPDPPAEAPALEAPAPTIAGLEPTSILATALRLIEECGAPCIDELTAGADRDTTFGLPIRPCRFATVAAQGYFIAAAAFATGRGHSLTDFLPPSVEPYAHHPLKLVATSSAVLIASLLVSQALHRNNQPRAADVLDCSLAGTTALAAYKMEQLAGVYDVPALAVAR